MLSVVVELARGSSRLSQRMLAATIPQAPLFPDEMKLCASQ